MSDRQGMITANQWNKRKLSFKLQLFSIRQETVSSTILQRKYCRTLSTQQNQILQLLLLFILNQKKGGKLQKLQMCLHLHWRESRNSLTLQDPESQQERILEGQPVHIVTFTCRDTRASGLVDYQSEKSSFELYTLCTRAE